MGFIESERLLLRPFQESDFADTFAIYRQAEVCRFLLHEPWQTETAAAAFAKKMPTTRLDGPSRPFFGGTTRSNGHRRFVGVVYWSAVFR